MLTITQILNNPEAPTTVAVFIQGSRPTDDTHWVVLKLIDTTSGKASVIQKLPADTSVPGQMSVSGSGLVSGKPAFFSVAFTRANGVELEGSNVVSINPQ